MKRSTSLALGVAVASSLASATAIATDNPFQFKPLPTSNGVLVAGAKTMPEGQCGADGKCGASDAAAAKKTLPNCTPQMRAEGKCGAADCKAAPGQCGSADMGKAAKPAKKQ